MSGKRLIAAGASAAGAIMLLWSFSSAVVQGFERKREGDAATIAPTYEERDLGMAQAVPDFSLSDRYGRQVKLSQFAAVDLLVVNIWSSECPPCIAEMPSLEELDKKLGSIGSAALITITTDKGWKDVSYIFSEGTDLRVLFDPEKKVTEGIFGTVRFPETFILDKQRRIRARFDGARSWHLDLLQKYIASYI